MVTLLYAQLVHAIGLNDVCDSLRLHRGLLVGLRGATPPSRNNLSHANRERDAALESLLERGKPGASPSPLQDEQLQQELRE